MSKFKDFKNYDDEVSDIDEVIGTDIKINPDYYIHNAILKAQNALIKDNVKEGVLQFYILVEHIETLCRAANMLPEDYETQINKYKDESKDFTGMAQKANFKLKLLMGEVFNNKVATDALHI